MGGSLRVRKARAKALAIPEAAAVPEEDVVKISQVESTASLKL